MQDQHRFKKFIYGITLNLSRQNLSDEDIPELILFLWQHPEITVLDLSLNHIGNIGLAFFVERNETVNQVNFAGNNINDEGLVHFARKNQVVTQVNFCYNLVSEKGIHTYAEKNHACYSSRFYLVGYQ